MGILSTNKPALHILQLTDDAFVLSESGALNKALAYPIDKARS